jgi:serine/threonine protein phosphatase PrpC
MDFLRKLFGGDESKRQASSTQPATDMNSNQNPTPEPNALPSSPPTSDSAQEEPATPENPDRGHPSTEQALTESQPPMPDDSPADQNLEFDQSKIKTAPLYHHDAPTPSSTPNTVDAEDTAQGSTTLAGEAEASETLDEDDTSEGTRQLSTQNAPSISVQRSAQGLAVAACRDIGRIRKVNQDSVFAMLTTLPRESADIPLGLFIVADGMGGHEGGEVASRLAIRTVVNQVIADLVLPTLDDNVTEALQPLIVSAVQEANSVIHNHAQQIHSDMGTTCTTVLLLGQALYIAHVGDTRAYLYEAGGLRLLTTDHSAVGRLIQLGQLAPEEAREHPLRNQLYRTVGQQPQIPVDFVYQPLGNSTHILLCSDGLWGMIDEEQLQQALQRSPWPQDVCQELIALANLAGGEDNISAIVVTLPVAERLS